MSSRTPMNLLGVARLVFGTELRGLLRDRRALFMAVVLPMLLFPLMLNGMDYLERSSDESMAERELLVAQDLRALGAAQRQAILDSLQEEHRHLVLEELPAEASGPLLDLASESSSEAARRLLATEGATWLSSTGEQELGKRRMLLLARRAAPTQESPKPELELRLVRDDSDNLANEAYRRVSEVLRELRDTTRLEGLIALLGHDPGRPLDVEQEDVASAADAQGQKLGKFLPLILVLILLSGGSFAALGAFAAEREEGTIETLLVQPVPSAGVAWGKWMAVLLTAVVASVGNALSFLFCLAMGWGASQGMGGEFALGSSIGRLALALLFFVPTAVFLSALLCLVSARAKSFREGQHYVMPLMLTACALAAASTQDRIHLSPLLAAVPVTGSTMLFRDTLAGNFRVLPAIASTISSLLLAFLALRQVAGILDDERVFASRGGESEVAQRRVQSRRALAWGWTAVLLVYLVGGRMQLDAPILGLALTLWVLVPILALLAARGTAKRAAESIARTLGLGAPKLLHVTGALLLAPALVVLMGALVDWQNGFMPMPKSMGQEELLASLMELSPLALVFLMGISPGIWEELLFRGAILSGLRRDLSPAKVVLWQMVLFGAVHASVHRFLATGILGGVLALLTLRSGRIWPAMLLHAGYNSLLVLEVTEQSWWSPQLALASGALGLVLLAVAKPRPS